MAKVLFLLSWEVLHYHTALFPISGSGASEIKVLNFGLARASAEFVTGNVTTRYWRAPEIMPNWTCYGECLGRGGHQGEPSVTKVSVVTL